ncbi:hypothetical protein [Arthrobacter sp. NEB 688]|uniref:hypothetical protein n=1 Tax=Arthrobacter sp. NEB 688 TaxID=904039 RepID=UPI00156402A7|nr:hypothetical protein [Arthrobacter sp. NEB 688]QKE85602.1 hypothetical protein HL663_17845 [Arthrobacter sp. NEB 688]
MTDQPWVAPGSGAQRPDPTAPPPDGWTPPTGPPPPGPPPPGAGYPPPPGAGYPPPPGYPPTAGPGPQPGWQPPAYRTVDIRPGIVPLRPLGLGDLYGGVLKAIRGNPAATIGLAALTCFALLLPTTALGAVLAGQAASDPLGSFATTDTVPDNAGISLVGQYLPSLGQILSAILLAGFLAQVVGQAVLGRKVGMGEIWRSTRGRVLPLVGVVLLTGLLLLVVLVVGVAASVALVVAIGPNDIGGILLAIGVVLLVVLVTVAVLALLSTRWAYAAPAVVLERVGVMQSLRRSWGLVGSPAKGPFWRVFGIRLLTGIITWVASTVITFPITLLLLGVVTATTIGSGSSDGGALLVAQTLVAGLAALLTGALTTPFSAGVDALLYVDGRMRREGLDIQLIQSAQGAAAPPWPPTSP